MAANRKNLPNKFDVDLSPFRDFIRHMDTFFNESFRQMNSQFDLRPFWIDMYETNDNIIVEADLPGYKKEQIQLEMMEYQLRIIAENNSTKENNEKEHIQKSYNKRERTITLPFKIPEEETKARFRDGKLKVIIPKDNTNRKFIDIL